MSGRLRVAMVACALAAASTPVKSADDGACTPGSGPRDWGRDIGRETLAANDGWASTPPATTGQSAAVAVGIGLRVNRPNSNIIDRTIPFEDSLDCSPAWDPTDGAQGNWNSAYDNISVTGAVRVWIDHDAFNDGAHPDRTQPTYFGRP